MTTRRSRGSRGEQARDLPAAARPSRLPQARRGRRAAPGRVGSSRARQAGYTQFLHDLLEVEVSATEQRRLASRTRLAGFPSTKTLEDFDFTAQPSLDRRLVDELATLRFIEEKANVLAIGPPGTGKTMLAIALGIKAVNAGYRVYYTTAADLVARTSRAALRAAGRRRCASGTAHSF